MKNYEKPELTVCCFTDEDIIRTSGFDGEDVYFTPMSDNGWTD